MNISRKLKNLSYNLYMIGYNLIHKRKNDVILIGGWMGLKFADNSRYLYQFLYENKDKYNLSKVIWVTRNKELNDKLNSLGYESYLIGTKESNYWHKVAAMHIICDAETSVLNFSPDIDSKYSFGAKKIQLWHGVGVKSVGLASNDANPKKYKSSPIISFVHTILSEGGWYDKKFLCTSKRNTYINQLYANDFHEDHYFISSYPRHCKCPKTFTEESAMIKKMKKHKYVFMYFPTFRRSVENYTHPLTDPNIIDFIKENDVLWIEKEHSASNYINDIRGSNIIELDQNFDINTIIPFASLIISDYSSVLFDAVHLGINCCMYAPDFEDFKNGDVGFIVDPLKIFKGHLFSISTNELEKNIESLTKGIYLSDEEKQCYQIINRDYFENNYFDLDSIWSTIEAL